MIKIKNLIYLTTHPSVLTTLTVLSFYILNSTFCIAEVRYVSPTGNNIPPYLTWEDAANSIQDAINVCISGDTIYVANGIYKENLVVNTQISLIGLSMDSTVIDGLGLGDFTITINSSSSIENLNIYGRGESELTSRAIRSTTFFTLINITNCKLSDAGVGVSMVGGDVIAKNLFMINLSRGFNLFGESENYISNCLIALDNENSQGINIGFAPNVDNYITNNIILFTGTNNQQAIGISIDKPRKVFINNNLISGFLGGIDIQINIDSAIIKNNVLVNGGVGISSINDDVIINNIISKKNLTGIAGAPVQSDYNLFWENKYNYYFSNYGDSDRVADPMFIKDTLPNQQLDFDYHLQAYSPGIDKGNPNILDIDGSRSDIGLYGGPLGQSYKYKDLPPKSPVNLTAIVDTNGIFLKWNRNSEADTSHYNVYRNNKPDFIIDSTKLIASPVDTLFVDTIIINENLYYRITAVDNQGNESSPSEEIMVKPVSADEYPYTVNDYILYQNYPNPFNPSTTIGYKLKERGYVKLMVYDITGSLVSVLINKEQEAGYYEVEFDVKSQRSEVKSGLASGIYLYRIEVIGEGRIPVYSDMKKMILIK